MQELRSAAVDIPMANQKPSEGLRGVYQRSAAVRIYVLTRAGNTCEGCQKSPHL